MLGLQIIIGADEKDLATSIKRAKKQLTDFEKSANKAVAPLGARGANNPLNRGSKNMANFGKKMANVTPTILEFNRVIQDAPFGIQGVANNLTQLTDNFINLRKNTGGTRSALLQVAKGFLGPAGIAFAVSAVTSLLVTYGDRLFKTTSATKELSNATKGFLGSAESEKATLESLLLVARDESRTKEQRLRAIQKIEKQYGSYLPNLSLETINTEKVAKAINQVTEGLVRQAKIRGVQDLITKKASEIAEKTAEVIAETNAELREGIGLKGPIDPREQRAAGVDLDKVNEKVKNIRQSLSEDIVNNQISKETRDLQDEVDKLQAQLQNLIGEDFDLNGVFSGEQVEIKPKVAPVSTLEVEEAIKPITTVLKKVKNSGGDTIKIRVELEDELKPIANTDDLLPPVEAFDEYRNRLRQAQSASQLFTDAAGASFQALGQSIANSLGQSNQIFGAFVSSILQSLTQLLTQTLQAAVQNIAIQQANSTANAVAAGTQSAAASGPAAAFVLPALIGAAVAAVAAAFSGIAGFNTGGFVGDKNLVRMNGNEMVLTPLDQTKLFNIIRNGNIQGSVSGTGGNTPVQQIVVTGKLRGRDVLLSGNRQRRRNKRFGG